MPRAAVNPGMPSGEELATAARNALERNYLKRGVNPFQKQYLKSHCDDILNELLNLEYAIFQRKEREINSERLWNLFKPAISNSEKLTTEKIQNVVKSKFDDLRTFYKSISQSRASRAGGSLENHIYFIFQKLGYPFDYQHIINGTPDFILPDAKLYAKTPSESILVTAKRTLRERWRQIITEGFKSPQYFLLTIDNNQNAGNLREMAGHRIYLVIPAPIRESNETYMTANNVLSLRMFFEDYLDPAMKQWKQFGSIK